MKLVYIHGANATGASFNYIRTHLATSNDILLSYDSTAGFTANLQDMMDTLQNEEAFSIVAHSLGGIYAVHLANTFSNQTQKVVTISTPYGGSEMANFVQYLLPFNKLMQDITPSSQPIRHANKMEIACPWVNIVTTRGNSPFLNTFNDGVVTLSSMRHREDIKLIDVYANHYEILIMPDTVDIIRENLLT